MSVIQQTDVLSIDKVIVSENGLNKESESVCLEFANAINVEYFFHEKTLPISIHLQWVLSKVESGYGAMLCDDDWWDIHHLALAKESILLNNKCVAYFSNHAYSKGISTFKNVYSDWIKSMHFLKSDFTNFKPNIYNKKQIFAICSIITPFHFSSMVCEGNVLRESVKIFAASHPTYYDRILFPVISTYGDVVYNPLATAIILYHDGMDGNTYATDEWKVERQKGSLNIINLGNEKGIDVKSDINSVYHNYDADDRDFLYAELKGIYYERDNLGWFLGYDRIINEDREAYKLQASKNTVRYKLKLRLRSLVSLIYHKVF